MHNRHQCCDSTTVRPTGPMGLILAALRAACIGPIGPARHLSEIDLIGFIRSFATPAQMPPFQSMRDHKNCGNAKNREFRNSKNCQCVATCCPPHTLMSRCVGTVLTFGRDQPELLNCIWQVGALRTPSLTEWTASVLGDASRRLSRCCHSSKT